MKIDVSTVSPARDEEEDEVLVSNSEKPSDEPSVKGLDCGDNCLNGIKWQPEHHKKISSSRKAGLTINGFRRFNPTLVTHGGRTLKLPARYMESDSDDAISSPSKFHSGKKKRRSYNSSRRKNSKICKNGRTKPLESDYSNSSKECSRKSAVLSSKPINGERTELGLQIIDHDGVPTFGVVESSSTCSCSSSQPADSLCLRRNLNEDCLRTDTNNSVQTPKRKGRPPKNSRALKNLTSISVDNRSPHGNCVPSATKASLASPSTSKFGKKRKLSKVIRNSQGSCVSSSSDESESMVPTPKRKGRPPNNCLASCETKHEIFRTQNGVRKPWVRPMLKTVDKRSLLKTPRDSLKYLLDSPDKVMSAVKSKFVKLNGCNLVPSKETEVVKPKRGRPPKPKPEISIDVDGFESGAFHFTGEEGQNEAILPTLKRKLKKLKLKKSEDKRPLAVSALNNRVVSQHLKRKAVDRAKRTLKVRKQLATSKNNCKLDSEIEGSSELPQKRRRRNKADRILGMKKSLSGTYEYLIQWKDGTSSWAPSDELVDYEVDFKSFLGHEDQELTVVNRLAYHAYWKDDLIQRHGDQSAKSRLPPFDDSAELLSSEEVPAEDSLHEEFDVSDRQYICKEVSIQKVDGCLHVTVTRTSGKRRKINERILDSLTLVLEDAATDESDFVVLSGLGDDDFCGVNLSDITRLPCEDEPRNYRRDVDKIRYLVQVMIDFPKPLVAALRRPAQGLGAQIVSLCDMVCDEASIGKPLSLQNVSKGRVPYCFPRLMGHTTLNEQVLIGRKVPQSQVHCRESASAAFSKVRFTANLSTSLKAMAVPHRMVYDDNFQTESTVGTLTELEKLIADEERKARECINDINILWREVVQQDMS